MSIYDIIVVDETECVLVPKSVLELHHRGLIAQIKSLREALNFKPLQTGKEQRRQVA